MEDEGLRMKDGKPICIGKGVCLREVVITAGEMPASPGGMAVLSIGAIGNAVAEAIDLLEEGLKTQDKRPNSSDSKDSETKVISPSSFIPHPSSNESSSYHIAHYDMRWLKPLDEDLLREVGERFKTIVTVEDGVIDGGLGSAVLEWMADHGFTPRVIRLGVRDRFVEHGSTQELYHLLKLDKEGICESLLQALEK